MDGLISKVGGKSEYTMLEELRSDVEEHLKTNCNLQLRNLVCETNDSAIVLRGHVDSFYLKQLAQETVRRLEPRAAIANLVTVN